MVNKKIEKIKMLGRLVLAKCTNKSRPLFVGWSLTNKCNYKCSYCGIEEQDKHKNEYPFIHIIEGINRLKKNGVYAISFSGGEPLLREDFGKILSHCAKLGIYTKLVSNAELIPEKIHELTSLNAITLTLNGPQDVHDSLREKGSYNASILALPLLKNYGIRIRINMVLCKNNYQYIPEMLQFAQEHNVLITFQPLELREADPKRVKNLQLLEEEFKSVYSFLIKEKEKGNKNIGASLSGLHFVANNWPRLTRPIQCYFGGLHYRINTDGCLVSCDRQSSRGKVLPVHLLESDYFGAAIARPCAKGCWRNNTIELNHLLQGNPDSILNILNKI